jgi:hypothetical protein
VVADITSPAPLADLVGARGQRAQAKRTDRRLGTLVRGELHIGDILYTNSSHNLTVSAVANRKGTQTMYNLTIATDHTYYVAAGTTQVLVHNAPPEACRLTSAAESPQIMSRTVYNNGTIRVDVENPAPGREGAANIHVQFMGRGADPVKYYYNASDGTWVSETGQVLSSRVAGQIPQSAIDKAYQYLGTTP